MGLLLKVGYAAPVILILLAGSADNGVTAESRSSGKHYTYPNRAPAQTNQPTRRTYNYPVRRPLYRYQYSPSAYSRYGPNGYPFYTSRVPYTYRYGSQILVGPQQGSQILVGPRQGQNLPRANIPGIGSGPTLNQGSPGLSVSPAQSQSGPLGQPGYQASPGYQAQPVQTAFTCKTASLTCAVARRGYCECENQNRMRERGATVN
jgi:hypothetical protein